MKPEVKQGRQAEEGQSAFEAIESAWPAILDIKPDFVETLGYKKDEDGRALLRLKYIKDLEDSVPLYKIVGFKNKLGSILADHCLDFGSELSSDTFWMRLKTIDGKTNWRRWLPYWQKFSPKQQELLDEMATEVGEQQGGDRFDRFSNYLRQGKRLGLLTQAEYDDLYGMLYQVVNC